ncbi:hypothetical protein QWY31_05740 [Cytophagales bacterium LB-30]|uniref:Uncharacterized protein n=1 Tax=Shiella aurantiaca TaxID=3058365 RepID=A0ABT8F422_9BACT|nr:hypothetical protein [Shiella aurantiaca]MDN4164994.1 hypothetical protein [Shiella aurantiaca]
MKSKLILVLACVLSYYSSSMAQSNAMVKGYYLSGDDTIKGFLKDQSLIDILSKGIYFSEKKDQRPWQLNGNSVNGFFLESDLYFTQIVVEGERFLVEALAKGPITLYAGFKANEPVFWLEKEGVINVLESGTQILKDANGNSYQRKSTRFRGVLLVIMKDAPDLHPEISTLKYSEKEIVNVIQKYNNVKGEPSGNWSKKKTKLVVKPSIQVMATINKSRIFYETPFSDVVQSYVPTVNAAIGLLAYQNTRIHFVFNLAYAQYKSRLIDYKDLSSSKLSNVEMGQSFVEAHLGGRYFFDIGIFKPFVQATFRAGYLVDKYIENQYIYSDSGDYFNESFDPEYRMFKMGIRPAVGLQYKRWSLYIEPHFENSADGPNEIIRRSGFSTGIIFVY